MPLKRRWWSARLECSGEPVVSGYLRGFGDAANYANTVVDSNDAPNEPQLTLYANQAADQGCFVHHFFNTATTGTNVTLRGFHAGLTGTGAAPQYSPLAA
jgi:hypothetical protein